MKTRLSVTQFNTTLGWALAAMWAYRAGSQSWVVPAGAAAIWFATWVVGLVDER